MRRANGTGVSDIWDAWTAKTLAIATILRAKRAEGFQGIWIPKLTNQKQNIWTEAIQREKRTGIFGMIAVQKQHEYT